MMLLNVILLMLGFLMSGASNGKLFRVQDPESTVDNSTGKVESSISTTSLGIHDNRQQMSVSEVIDSKSTEVVRPTPISNIADSSKSKSNGQNFTNRSSIFKQTRILNNRHTTHHSQLNVSLGFKDTANASQVYPLQSEMLVCHGKDLIQDSCEGRCGDFTSLRCSCDYFCQIYNHCCGDFMNVCPRIWEVSKKKYGAFGRLSVECVSMYRPGYYVIVGCLRNLSDLAEKCATFPESPVTLRKSGLHFKNIECFMCNGFQKAYADIWSIDAFLDKTSSRNLENNVNKIFSAATFTWDTKQANYLRLCQKGIISICPEGSTAEIVNKCSSRTDSVWTSQYDNDDYRDKTFYSNEHCAQCNTVDNKSLSRVCRYTNIAQYLSPHLVTDIRFTMSWTTKRTVTFATDRYRSPYTWSEVNCSVNNIGETKNCNITKCTNKANPRNQQCPLIQCVRISLYPEMDDQGRINKSNLMSSLRTLSSELREDYYGSAQDYSLDFVKVIRPNDTLHGQLEFHVTVDTERMINRSRIQAFELTYTSIRASLSDTGYTGRIVFCFRYSYMGCQDVYDTCHNHQLKYIAIETRSNSASNLHGLNMVIYVLILLLRLRFSST